MKLLIGSCIILALIMGCASNHGKSTQRNLEATAYFESYCKMNSIKSHAATEAGIMTTQAKSAKEEGDEDEAYWKSDMATSYYKIAVAKHQLEISNEQNMDLKNEVENNLEHYKSLQEVYQEIKSLKR